MTPDLEARPSDKNRPVQQFAVRVFKMGANSLHTCSDQGQVVTDSINDRDAILILRYCKAGWVVNFSFSKPFLWSEG